MYLLHSEAVLTLAFELEGRWRALRAVAVAVAVVGKSDFVRGSDNCQAAYIVANTGFAETVPLMDYKRENAVVYTAGPAVEQAADWDK